MEGTATPSADHQRCALQTTSTPAARRLHPSAGIPATSTLTPDLLPSLQLSRNKPPWRTQTSWRSSERRCGLRPIVRAFRNGRRRSRTSREIKLPINGSQAPATHLRVRAPASDHIPASGLHGYDVTWRRAIEGSGSTRAQGSSMGLGLSTK